MPEGCDISEHQGDLAPDWFDQWDYVIIRAVNENGYPDVKFRQNWERAAGRTLRGVYGWPIPGGRNLALGADLVEVAPDAEAGYWADVERSGRGLASPDDVKEYLRGIGDHVRGFYSNIPECPRSPFLDGEMWWVADYGPNNGQRHDPYEQPPKPDRPYTIHQYTSNPLDTNYSETLDWTGASSPEPPKEEDRMQPELMADKEGIVWVYDANAHTKTRVDGPATLNALTSIWALHGVSTKIADSGAAQDVLKGAVEIH